MIQLDALISAVQSAVSSASDTVAEKNLDLLEKYFVEITDGDELQGIIRSSIDSAEAAIDQGADEEARDNLREAARALAAAADRVKGNDPKGDSEPFYVPKRVMIQYPYLGPKGKPSVKNVQVPLLTLVPMGMPEVSEVRFRANLELSATDDGKINVSFGPATPSARTVGERSSGSGTVSGQDVSASTATIDITVSGHRAADGLRKVVEGYEKALRAQIPG